MGSIHQSKAQQSKKPNPSLLSLASVSPRAPGADPPSVPTHTPPPRPPGAAVRAPAPPGPAPVRLRLRPPASACPAAGAAGAGPSPRRRPSRQQQREGGGTSRPAASGADEYCSCAPPSLHPRLFNSSKPATQQDKGKRNTLDPHPSTYQCSIQDFLCLV